MQSFILIIFTITIIIFITSTIILTIGIVDTSFIVIIDYFYEYLHILIIIFISYHSSIFFYPLHSHYIQYLKITVTVLTNLSLNKAENTKRTKSLNEPILCISFCHFIYTARSFIIIINWLIYQTHYSFTHLFIYQSWLNPKSSSVLIHQYVGFSSIHQYIRIPKLTFHLFTRTEHQWSRWAFPVKPNHVLATRGNRSHPFYYDKLYPSLWRGCDGRTRNCTRSRKVLGGGGYVCLCAVSCE